jgi:NADPH:quinone reductase-like Zn-dependent oxidoreductase
MRALVFDEYGPPEVLEVKEVPKPTPGPHDLLIQVVAAGLNAVDYKIRRGEFKRNQSLPIIPGFDVAGIVVGKGDQVQEFQLGDEVFAFYWPQPLGLNGCCAEFVSVPANVVAHKPKVSSWAEAAGIPLAGLTAYQALFNHLKLQGPRQSILILGGTGGVGSFAVELAQATGAEVLATCSPENAPYVRTLGATLTFDHHKPDWITKAQKAYPNGIDLIFDTVGESNKAYLGLLAPGGTVVSCANFDIEKEAQRAGKTGICFMVEPNASQLRHLAKRFDNSHFSVRVETFKLDKAREAHQILEAGHTVGKLVLMMRE